MPKKKSSKRERDIRTFIAEPDVAQMLDKAVEAGETQQKLITEALRIAGPGVLAKVVKSLREKADELEKNIPEDKR